MTESYTLLSRDDSAVVFASKTTKLRLQVPEDGLLRIGSTMKEQFALRGASMIVNAEPFPTKRELNDTDDGAILSTGKDDKAKRRKRCLKYGC